MHICEGAPLSLSLWTWLIASATNRKFPVYLPPCIHFLPPGLCEPEAGPINSTCIQIHTPTYTYTVVSKMASLVRSFRTVAATAAAATRPSASKIQARAFGFSAIRKAGGGPPQLLGPGAKAGEVPTE